MGLPGAVIAHEAVNVADVLYRHGLFPVRPGPSAAGLDRGCTGRHVGCGQKNITIVDVFMVADASAVEPGERFVTASSSPGGG